MYWKFKEEALDRTPWRTCFGRGYGPVVSQPTERMTLGLSYDDVTIINMETGVVMSK
jgi:hypothetical protein